MSIGMRARMNTMRIQIRMRRNKHRKCMINQRRMWMTYLGTSDVDGYEGEDHDEANADADEEEEASQVNDGSTQNVEA
jgi:hypothetical protein